MRLLVTGGAGYIGHSLVSKLKKERTIDRVIVYDNLSRGAYNSLVSGLYNSGDVQFVNGDILDGLRLRQVLKGIDIVIHLAGLEITPFVKMDHHLYDQVNNWGTAQVVQACQDSNIRKFIYLSSAAVYGHTDEPVNEEYLPKPDSYFGISKLDAERHCQILFGLMNTVILRVGNVYGINPCMKFDGVVHKFYLDSILYSRVSVDGNGRQVRPFIHLEDLCHYLMSIIRKDIPSGVYNVFTENRQVLELVKYARSPRPGIDVIYCRQEQSFESLILNDSRKIDHFISPNKNGFMLLKHFFEKSLRLHHINVKEKIK